MAMVRLLTQTETLGIDDQNVRYISHVVAAYMHLEKAHRNLKLFAQDAFAFNAAATEGAPTIVTFTGNSTVYALLGRTYSLEECPLH
jgi:hypothetical protein